PSHHDIETNHRPYKSVVFFSKMELCKVLRLYKIDIPDLNENDVVKAVGISDPSTELRIPAGLSFLVVNNDRLILLSEATIFELKKITD
ncbi:hypothetical protein P4V23_10915, partial [Brevibacillus agri]|nr:hypothetical protein [Brevibacillus agri]